MTARSVFVLGGGGWLGQAVLPRLDARLVAAPRSTRLDVADRSALERTLDDTRPAAVLNLAAVNPGHGDAGRMWRVNADGAANVAVACAARGIRLVHVSTDVVLDGRAAPYADDAVPTPLGAYGSSKAAGETAVHACDPDAAIVRTSLLFDPRTIDRGTAGFAARLRAGEPCWLFTDEIRCPCSRQTLADALVELVDSDVAGHLNVAGTRPLSRHQFGLRLLRHFGVAGLDAVEEALSSEVAGDRPLDLTLELARAGAVLRTPLRSVDDELAR